MADVSSGNASTLAAPAEARPSDSPARLIAFGLAVVALFFGAFGFWAALSPLDGAVVGDGVVTVDGNRKTVADLEGGIVRSVAVREGAHVDIGDVLVQLDDQKLRAQVDLYRQQIAVAKATEARLSAEYSGATEISFPPELLAGTEPYQAQAVASQKAAFEARRTDLLGAQQVLLRKIDDLRAQIAGQEGQQDAITAQIKSIATEQATLKGLLDAGLTTSERSLDLERASASMEGDRSAAAAAIASAQQNIAEDEQQIAQLINDQRAQAASDLNDVRARLLDLGPSLATAEAELARSTIRSPYEGKVVNLRVFSTGAVIPPNGPVLDIVPDRSELVVDAKIRVEDIADVRPGADAELHFTDYTRMYVPMVRGKVVTVSADRLTDERTGAAYYMAQVVADPTDLARSRDISLYPGMPAQVMVTTRKRSALEYLVGPLFAAYDGAFRQN